MNGRRASNFFLQVYKYSVIYGLSIARRDDVDRDDSDAQKRKRFVLSTPEGKVNKKQKLQDIPLHRKYSGALIKFMETYFQEEFPLM